MTQPYRDRTEAGRLLAEKLVDYAHRPEVVVLAVPGGGVPVAFEVAQVLGAPLDVFLVHNLGAPGQEELALGTIATGGVRLLNDAVVNTLKVPPEVIDRVTADEWQELARRERECHGDHPPPDVRDRIVILVDDGLTAGSTIRSAVDAVRRQGARRIVVAVPVADPSACDEFQAVADEIIYGRTPEPSSDVGSGYEDVSQTTDREVRDLLEQSRHDRAATGD